MIIGINEHLFTQVIDAVPRWPLCPIHISEAFHTFLLETVFDTVIELFVSSGEGYEGCQAYLGTHTSRSDSRNTVTALFGEATPATISSFLHLAATHTLIIREAYKILPFASEVRAVWMSRFSCHINTNLYLSSPSSDAFSLHQDPHHVFALQLSGSKRWHYSCDNDKGMGTQTILMTETLCKSGDILFIPKGTPHRAEAVSDSVHISVSIEEHELPY